MSHEPLNQRAEVRAIECRTSVACAGNPGRRRSRIALSQVWDIASSRVSLPRRGSGYRTPAPCSRAVDPHYVQDPRRRRPPITRVFSRQRNDVERHRNARAQGVPGFCAQAWLSVAQENRLRSVLTTSLTVCSSRSSSKSMRSLFPIAFVLEAIRRG
jgi:hypothetical protein